MGLARARLLGGRGELQADGNTAVKATASPGGGAVTMASLKDLQQGRCVPHALSVATCPASLVLGSKLQAQSGVGMWFSWRHTMALKVSAQKSVLVFPWPR